MFKKVFSLSLILVGVLFGDCGPKPCPPPVSRPCPPKKCRPCPPEPCTPCCPKPRPKPRPPCLWKFNPCNPKGCTDLSCGGVSFQADFLYWRAENHGFSYGYKLEDASLNIGRAMRVDPEWEPAFRVGLGWNAPYDFWEVLLSYTWYRNRSNDSQESSSSLGLIPIWPVSSSSSGQFSTGSGRFQLLMNMGDLELGRMIFLTKSVAIRPHLGARGGFIDQKFKSQFSGILSGSALEEKFKGKNDYWGVGPRFGIQGEYHLSQGFSIRGSFASALLYGKSKIDSLTEDLTEEGASFTVERQYLDEFYQLAPNLQIAFGFQWQNCFFCEQLFYKMGVFWESNYWWNQFQLPTGLSGFSAPLPTVGNQPLTMEGLTVNFQLDF